MGKSPVTLFDSFLPVGIYTKENSTDTVFHHAFLVDRFQNLKNPDPLVESESSWLSSPSLSSTPRSSTHSATANGFPVLQDKCTHLSPENGLDLSLPMLRCIQDNSMLMNVAEVESNGSDIESLPPPPPPPLYSDTPDHKQR